MNEVTPLIVSMENLSKSYSVGSNFVHALRQINLKIYQGESLAIMGPSGSGKSTLLNLLGGLDSPTEGHYLLNGLDVSRLNDDDLSAMRSSAIGFVFQSFNLIPRLNLFENVEVPLLYCPNPQESSGNQRRILHALTRVNLQHRLDHFPAQLSGGEMQRAAIARALAGRPSLILADEPTGNLDCATGQEILKFFHALNNEGATLIIVTHDEKVGASCKRIVRMLDGRIVDNHVLRISNVSLSDKVVMEHKHKTEEVSSRTLFRILQCFTSFYGQIKRSGRSLLVHRLRSFLSTLGVLFGVAAVVAMLSIGEGAKQEALEQIRLLGMHHLIIRRSALPEEQRLKASKQNSRGLGQRDIDALRDNIPSLNSFAPLKVVEANVTGSLNQISPEVLAVTRSFGEMKGLRAAEGRFICDLDLQNNQLVCVLGATVAKSLGRESRRGKSLRIGSIDFEIAGILEKTDWKASKAMPISPRNLDESIFIPMGIQRALNYEKLPSDMEEFSEIILQINTKEQLSIAARQVRQILEKLHGNFEDYQIIIPHELLAQAKRSQKLFNFVLGSIASISLLVGGIGIMNIMLATISDRTREIGIRRACGASKKHILQQFLQETLILTFSGALLGIVTGVVFSFAISWIAGWNTIVTPWSLFLSLMMSAIVGLCSGLYPAYQAAEMDPIKALRHE